ncbi:VOC family protein [Pseudoduganella sp. DS3]|uniref:VOC family protein n=1 Tax=Pseudoduganella guangdongensis TaxID=2692179 RepID=A0A6N9HPW8_9BURK|nr:VOC family protein [Pseudoduganella guangdongensis]MYN04842.1 VOC family protein [Pseudoduganella guangdongensis]
MRLNHIDLPVTDLEGAADYFQRGFGLERMPGPAGGMAILRGEDGFALILQQADKADYPAGFHVGFLQPTDAAVQAAYQRLADAGLPLPAPPAVSYGCLAFWCQAPGGILIEVSHRPG